MFRATILGGCAFLLVMLPLPSVEQQSPPEVTSSTPPTRLAAPEGAGLLVHCKHVGKRWILLGHDRRGHWEILGGHTEFRRSLVKGARKESALETAAREGFEESRMLLPYHEILHKARRLGKRQGFTIFTLESEYIPRARFREAFIPVDWKSYDEMDDYAWVELRVLLSEIRKKDKASSVRVRDIDGKREIRGLRPALFLPLKKLTNLWGLLLGDDPKPHKDK